MKHSKKVLLAVIFLTGCSTKLIVSSFPEGAIVSEIGSGQSYGETPATVYYNFNANSPKNAAGCYLVKGFRAQWRSGAVGSTPDVLQLCGGSSTFTISIPRPQVGGLNIDQDYAMQRQMMKAQQEAIADQRRAQANANLIQWYNSMKPQAPQSPVQCMRDAIGNFTCY